MKKNLIFSSFILSLFFSSLAFSKSMIGSLKTNPIPEDGCSCNFQTSADSKKGSSNFLFVSEIEETPAWMNIDGKDVQLKLTQRKLAKKLQMGAKDFLTFSGPNGIHVEQIRSVNFMCKKNDDDCEYTGYNSQFKVQKGNQKEMINLVGGCGC